MANINLLPWREEQRKERNRNTAILCIAMILSAAMMVFVTNTIVGSFKSAQDERNRYLQSEINKLNRTIKEINKLKAKRDALFERMEVIQGLQVNRSKVVHIFDDLVRKLPEGVYFDNLEKKGKQINLTGKAQSNGRVSALMRSLDSSDWFRNTSLRVVDVVDSKGARVSQFKLNVREQNKKKNNQIQYGEVK